MLTEQSQEKNGTSNPKASCLLAGRGSILVQGLAYFFLRAAAVPTGALHVRLLALQLRIIDSSLPVHVVRHRMQ